MTQSEQDSILHALKSGGFTGIRGEDFGFPPPFAAFSLAQKGQRFCLQTVLCQKDAGSLDENAQRIARLLLPLGYLETKRAEAVRDKTGAFRLKQAFSRDLRPLALRVNGESVHALSFSLCPQGLRLNLNADGEWEPFTSQKADAIRLSLCTEEGEALFAADAADNIRIDCPFGQFRCTLLQKTAENHVMTFHLEVIQP